MLARMQKSMKEKDQGFTLIEPLVVIIIIGILAAIAIPVFLNQRKKGVDAGIKSDLRQVANEMESAYTDTQTYPAGSAVTVKKTGGSNPNVLAVAPKANGYCVRGYNTSGTADSATNAYYYVSDQGGLKPSPMDAAAAAALG